MKNKNGITLIALVITIIVLIILAGVTISMIIGPDGLIKQADKAKWDTLNAQAESDERLNALEEEIKKATEGSNTNSDLAKFKAGDYVKYDTGNTTIGENGVITCRVLYEANSQYGLQIISDKNIKNVTLGDNDWENGKAAYNNVIETLNKEAEKYLNTKYAVDARSVGSIPISNNGIFISKNAETTKTVVLPLSHWEEYRRPNGWTSDDTGCKDSDNNFEMDYNTMTSLGIQATGASYLLASRCLSSYPTYSNFDVYSIYGSGEFTGNESALCSITRTGNSTGYMQTSGIRACFSLKSDVKIESGDGKSEQTAYMLK